MTSLVYRHHEETECDANRKFSRAFEVAPGGHGVPSVSMNGKERKTIHEARYRRLRNPTFPSNTTT